MSITSFTATVLGCNSSNITLHMSQATNVFNLSQITIDFNSGVSGFVGCWSSGTLAHGGSRTVEVDPTDYGRLESECVPNTSVTVTVTFHDSGSQHCIDNIDCVQASLAHALSALAKISSQLDESNVVSEVRTLNETARAQLGVHERVLATLEQQARPSAPWNGDERRRRKNGDGASTGADPKS
jgi:hypothetical protein